MDEPTNHLDLHATEWLEGVLLQWKGSMVVVSHDRYFLDRVATRIWELARQRMEVYRGNYSHYSQQRAERRERQLKEWERQQGFIAKEQDYIRRNIAGQNTKQAQGRRTGWSGSPKKTALSTPAGREGHPAAPGRTAAQREHGSSDGRPGHRLPPSERRRPGAAPRGYLCGFEYLGSRLPIGPDDNLLFRSENIELKRGERVALLGPNGAGKSTFLKTIMGNLPPLSGKVRVGASVHPGYLAQAHSDLRPEMTVLNAILEKAPRMEIGQARSFLGRFLFSGDDVAKPISSLSGGQRSRVALARLTLEGANLLLLDEPTNHLDIHSQEVLEDVLEASPARYCW